MSSRDLILSRVRTAVAGAPDAPRTRPRAVPAATGGQTAERTVELFAERVADYRAVVHVAAPGEAAGVITAALARRAAERVVVPEGLPKEWAHAVRAHLGGGAVGDDPPLSAADLDAVCGVVTGCAVGIAETGTIVLDTGPGQGRRALTLVPDYHLCLVRAGQIVPGVPEAVAALDPVRPLTWISGPSATSDIELNRVEGVHGPRTLEVVVVR
ncbi:LUD domain-containing protein [Planomonospora sp. ID82291]|uniref:LutC/YkgG family protein n=1 Tax=Planomonospora sp. ID82291 TaxID=2738136 RepID=UPI0018C437FC|nr:LUD domain-containing protein [Planomonospora sp. ID82291]MBG0815732.1 LUD domain-containing protein [Planomonospora sp. ID82291]